MICKHCGGIVNEGNEFCPNCGMKAEENTNSVEQGEFQNNEQYQDNDNENFAGSKGGLFGLYENASRYFNNQLDGILRWIAKTSYSFWLILFLWVLFGFASTLFLAKMEMNDFFNGAIFSAENVGWAFFVLILCLVIFPISFFIEKLIVEYASRGADFRYGMEMSEERDKFIIFALFLGSLVSFVFKFTPVLRKGIVYLILGFFLYPLFFTTVFYRYFKGDQLERFVKKYFKFQLVFWAVIIGLIILLTVVSSGFFWGSIGKLLN